MKPRVIIRAFTLRRDIGITFILADKLREVGYSVYICNSRNYERVLRLWQPNLVLLNTISHVEITKKLSPSTKIVFLQAEGAKQLQDVDHFDGSVEEERKTDFSFLLSRPETLKSIEKYLVWGPYALETFSKRFSAKKECFVQVGNPRLDLVRYHQTLPRKKRDRFTIGILGRFHLINRFDGVPVIWTLNRKTEKNTLLSIRQYYLLRQIMEKIHKETDFLINYRAHPQESISGYKDDPIFQDRFTVSESYDLSDWIADVDMIISPGSTSIVEAHLLGTPVISIDRIVDEENTVADLNSLTASVYAATQNPTTIEELLDALTNKAEQVTTPEFASYLSKIHGWNAKDTSSLSKILGIILRVCPPKYSPKLVIPRLILELFEYFFFQFERRFRYRHIGEFSYQRGFHKSPSDLKRRVHFVFDSHDKKPK